MRYEYKRIKDTDPYNFKKNLEFFGSKGWEFMGVFHGDMVFKRAIGE